MKATLKALQKKKKKKYFPACNPLCSTHIKTFIRIRISKLGESLSTHDIQTHLSTHPRRITINFIPKILHLISQQSRFLQNPINNPQHLHNVQHSRHLNVATNVHCYHLDERLSLSLSPHILKISENTRDFPRPEKFPRIYIFTPSSHVTALRSCFASRKL